jgi:hypothetical protein
MSTPKPQSFVDSLHPKKLLKGLKVQFKANIPLHRPGLPEEMASAALFWLRRRAATSPGSTCPSMVVSSQSSASFRAEADRGNELVRSRHDDCEQFGRDNETFFLK